MYTGWFLHCLIPTMIQNTGVRKKKKGGFVVGHDQKWKDNALVLIWFFFNILMIELLARAFNFSRMAYRSFIAFLCTWLRVTRDIEYNPQITYLIINMKCYYMQQQALCSEADVKQTILTSLTSPSEFPTSINRLEPKSMTNKLSLLELYHSQRLLDVVISHVTHLCF